MSEHEEVVSLIKEVGCWRLGNWDGCCCSRFSVRNVDVDIHCGKGIEQSVWVSSLHLDYDDDTLLHPIMDEVVKQVTEKSGRGGTFAQYINKKPRREIVNKGVP
jgi:hypothetical protein